MYKTCHEEDDEFGKAFLQDAVELSDACAQSLFFSARNTWKETRDLVERCQDDAEYFDEACLEEAEELSEA